MNLAGLSPDKAPPAEAPLRLFYLLPVFLGLAGLLLMLRGGEVFSSRWSPEALAVTHLIVLGALTPVMCGALLQITPVLLGGAFPHVRALSATTATGLALGALLIPSGFLLARPALLAGGGTCAGVALLIFVLSGLYALRGHSGHRRAARAARYAVGALAVTVSLGMTLALARLGWLQLPGHLHWIDTHVAWGLGGWIGVLLAGIGMEIIPMFYITPPFATGVKRWLAPVAVVLLCALAASFVLQSGPLVHRVLLGGLFATHLTYHLGALLIEQRRQRPRRDAHLWLWQLGHVGVSAAFAAWLFGAPPPLTGTLLLGAALALLIGTLLKIVPFMSWLDLQARRSPTRHALVRLPRLRALLPDGRANMVAASLAAAVLLAPGGVLTPWLASLSGVLLLLCAVLLGRALLLAERLRRATLQQLAA